MADYLYFCDNYAEQQTLLVSSHRADRGTDLGRDVHQQQDFDSPRHESIGDFRGQIPAGLHLYLVHITQTAVLSQLERRAPDDGARHNGRLALLRQ